MAVRTKKLTRQRVKTDPAFERTRENAAEFGRAVKAVKLMKQAFRDLIIIAGDGTLHNRLQGQAMRILQTDPVSDRGERKVSKGDPSIWKDFNFNDARPLYKTLYSKRTIHIDRATGVVTVNMPPFIPAVRIDALPNTSHYQLTVVATMLDFDNDRYEQAVQETDPLPWDRHETAPISLTLSLPPATTLPIMVAIGISFGQPVRNRMYPTAGDHVNAAAIIEINEV